MPQETFVVYSATTALSLTTGTPSVHHRQPYHPHRHPLAPLFNMVRTRRGKVQGTEPDQAESPALHATRAAKHRRARKTAAVSTPNGVASPVPPARARRLRSDKSSASPLQKLDETTRKRVTRSQKETPAVAPKEDEEEYEEEDTGLFFQESFKQSMHFQYIFNLTRRP